MGFSKSTHVYTFTALITINASGTTVGIESRHHLKTKWKSSWSWMLTAGMLADAFLFRNIPGSRLTNTIAIVDCFHGLSN